jgi:hypothetical protein
LGVGDTCGVLFEELSRERVVVDSEGVAGDKGIISISSMEDPTR